MRYNRAENLSQKRYGYLITSDGNNKEKKKSTLHYQYYCMHPKIVTNETSYIEVYIHA